MGTGRRLDDQAFTFLCDGGSHGYAMSTEVCP
jgi:hypothetical protein